MPQFQLNGKSFDAKHLATEVSVGSAAQWTLTSNMNYFHPFHIHINPFQVKSTSSAFLMGDYFKASVFGTELEPASMWRDTVYVPPLGQTVIWQRFGRPRLDFQTADPMGWPGKTVFHCHFFDHSDQGMMAAFLIGPGASPPPPGISYSYGYGYGDSDDRM